MTFVVNGIFCEFGWLSEIFSAASEISNALFLLSASEILFDTSVYVEFPVLFCAGFGVTNLGWVCEVFWTFCVFFGV